MIIAILLFSAFFLLPILKEATKKRLCEILKSQKVVKGNKVKKGQTLSIEELQSFTLNDIFFVFGSLLLLLLISLLLLLFDDD